MKKATLWISTITLGLFLCLPTFTHAESIKKYNSEITVELDGSVSVVETITYDSEGLSKHGIFRDITPKSSQGNVMDIGHVSVTDESGVSIPWQRESNSGDVRLKIGDPNRTFVGVKTYVIRYTATNAVAHLKNNIDEIYWNVTGNNWPFSIEQVTAQVALPNIIHERQESCYMGVVGSTEGCSPVSGGFLSRRTLAPGEGMTVAVGFAAGFIHAHIPTLTEKILHFLKAYWPFLIPLITSVVMFRRWYKKGRDPKGSAIIVPQYDVPDGLTPMEVGSIVYQKSRTTDVSAEIIYLATKGYIKIRETEEKIIGLFPVQNYELIYLKDRETLSNECDKELLTDLFSRVSVGGSVTLSSLRNSFYTKVSSLFLKVRDAVLSNGYYSYLPVNQLPFAIVIFMIPLFFALTMFGSIFFGGFVGIDSSASFFLLFFCIISSFVIFSVFQAILPAKTQKGVTTKEYILGLKQYLLIAEKDRIDFHNAPEKKPEVFEQLLPYAMVLGVETQWAKEFKDIYTVAPSWYEGVHAGSFNAVVFTNTLSSFSTIASSSLTSSPHHSSGGSGGGGFSGGGGGGGGGGSW